MSVRQTIPPLPQDTAIVDPKTGKVTISFQQWWQQLTQNGDFTFDELDTVNTELDTKVPNTRLINTTTPIAGGGPLSSDLTLTHANTAVTPGSYTNVSATVDQKGHITAMSSGSAAAAFRGALVTKSADENTANYSTARPIAFNTETRDTSGIHPYTATVTITIATPGVVTWTAHGFLAGAPVVFTTSGALPTGLTAGTTYYVIAAGLAANTFQVSATPGGAAVNTSGSQSGTHTGTNYSRLIVPVGVSKVFLRFNLLLTNVAANTDTQVQLLKNGAGGFSGTIATAESNSGTSPRWGGTSATLDVTGGTDYFEIELGCADTSISVLANYSWFEMVVVE